MREGYHATAAVGLEGGHHIVWHVSYQLGARHVPAADKLFAWIAHRDGKPAEQRHGGQVFRQLPGSDEQHAVLGAEGVGELRGIHHQLGRYRRRLQADPPIGEQHGALHQLTRLQPSNQFRQTLRVGVIFQQQLQRAAAGQSKPVGLVGRHSVLHKGGRPAGYGVRQTTVRPCGLRVGAGMAVDQVVFNATAGYRAHHRTRFAQGHDGADGPRRRPPGAHHRGQQSALARLAPSQQGAQHHHIQIFHAPTSLQALACSTH